MSGSSSLGLVFYGCLVFGSAVEHCVCFTNFTFWFEDFVSAFIFLNLKFVNICSSHLMTLYTCYQFSLSLHYTLCCYELMHKFVIFLRRMAFFLTGSDVNLQTNLGLKLEQGKILVATSCCLFQFQRFSYSIVALYPVILKWTYICNIILDKKGSCIMSRYTLS